MITVKFRVSDSPDINLGEVKNEQKAYQAKLI